MVSVWGLTDRGIIEDGDLAWGVVCDGMGGAKAGDIASKMAVETFCAHLEQLRDLEGPPPAADLLLAAAEDANRVVYLKAETDRDCVGMGTTLVGMILRGTTLWVVNVGDSRAYHINGDGIVLITRDHSLVEDLVERGELTREQARTHPHKNLITRALGAEPVLLADCFRQPLAQGDFLLLCSDGLSNLVTEQEMLYEVIHGGDSESCPQRLLDIALHRGAPDNVTAVLIRC